MPELLCPACLQWLSAAAHFYAMMQHHPSTTVCDCLMSRRSLSTKNVYRAFGTADPIPNAASSQFTGSGDSKQTSCSPEQNTHLQTSCNSGVRYHPVGFRTAPFLHSTRPRPTRACAPRALSCKKCRLHTGCPRHHVWGWVSCISRNGVFLVQYPRSLRRHDGCDFLADHVRHLFISPVVPKTRVSCQWVL